MKKLFFILLRMQFVDVVPCLLGQCGVPCELYVDLANRSLYVRCDVCIWSGRDASMMFILPGETEVMQLEAERDKIMYAHQKEDSTEGSNNISTAFRDVANDLTPIIGHYLTALYPWRRRPVSPTLDVMMSWYPRHTFDNVLPGIPCDFTMYDYRPDEIRDHGSIWVDGTRNQVIRCVQQGDVVIYLVAGGSTFMTSAILRIIIEKLIKQVTNKI